MAANKRRKLDGSGGGSGSSTPTTPMSAFAARQQLWGAATRAASVLDKATPEPAPEEAPRSRRSETPSARSVATRSSKRQPPEGPVPGPVPSVETKQTKGQGIESDKGRPVPITPLPETSGRLIRQHSSFKPSKKNLQRKVGGRLLLTTPEAERLVILGSYGIKVHEGEATVAGAILAPSDDVQWIHAAHCHAVPVLRTADDTVLELQPHPAAKDLRQLAKLNPAFAKLWNESPDGKQSKSKSTATYQIIYTSDDIPKRAVLQELVSPAKWNKKLSGMAAAKRKGTPVVFLCGPKSSGKSTFGRLLANRLMTDRGGSKHTPWSSIMVLDLDPGQPEYSPAGVISLSKITAPNLSPSFCHPTLSAKQGLLRAHAIASVTPALDPAHFIECVLDLFAHYQRSPDAKCPLVINTPGWIQGTGLDILTELIASIRPTEVIYMSQDGPEETVNSLQSACTTAPPIPFSALPSQPSEGSSSRTSLHLRTMQTMSYFHLRQTEPLPSWDPTPLADMRPWRVRYAGKDRGFSGILCYDHQPAPELLSEAINGTILALVKVESRAAFRDLLRDADADADTEADTHTESDADLETDSNCDPLNNTNNNTAEPSSTDTTTTVNPPPKTTKDKETNIPLIPNPLGQTLSPTHSHCLGLVLVRGIDTSRNELHLLTPLSGEVMTSLRGEEELVLVAGRFDTPSWAYCEGLYSSGGGAKGVVDGGRGGGSDGEGEEDGDEDGEGEGGDEDGGGSGESDEEEKGGENEGREVPWVEMLHGSQKRAVGSKVWRVRRDLGRN